MQEPKTDQEKARLLLVAASRWTLWTNYTGRVYGEENLMPEEQLIKRFRKNIIRVINGLRSEGKIWEKTRSLLEDALGGKQILSYKVDEDDPEGT
jgi:hypothetical protein